MLTQTSSPIGLEEQQTLHTQTGGNGNGSIITIAPSISGPDDDEPRTVILGAQAFLLRQRIKNLLNVTDHRNEMKPRTSLREQRAYAIFGTEGGVM